MHLPWKSKNRGCTYLDLFRRRRRWRCWKSQGKLVYWMKRGSKYWRFCLVRSFCINQPQVSYYPRWHAGSGTRRGGTLRKKAFFQSILIVLSSITIIIKADHFQALALNSSPFSNPKSQSPPPRQRSRLWLRSEAVLELQSRKGPEADYTMALITPNPQNI